LGAGQAAVPDAPHLHGREIEGGEAPRAGAGRRHSLHQEDIGLNVKIMGACDERAVPEKEEKVLPTPAQVEENKRKWGYAA